MNSIDDPNKNETQKEKTYLLNALRESEQQYRALIECSTDPIYILQNNRLVMVNPAWEKLFGYSMTEATSENFDYINIVAPESREYILKRASNREKGIKVTLSYEFKGITKEGCLIDIEANLSDIIWGGQPAIQGIYHDMTKYKKVEESLRESEERFRNVFENAPIGILISNLFGEIIFSNKTFQEMLGYTEREIKELKIFDITLPEDIKGESELLKRAADRNILLKKENHYRRKDGSLILARLTASVVKDSKGKLLYTVGLIEDITETKRAELEREALYEIGSTINITSNMSELLNRIHRIVKKVMYAENFYISIYEHHSQSLWFPIFVDQYDSPPSHIPLGKGLTEYILRTGKPLLLTKEIMDELVKSNKIILRGAPSKSWLGVPLKLHSNTIGVMVVQNYNEYNKYTEREEYLLSTIGNQIALIIERRVAEETRLRVETRFKLVWEESVDGLRLTDENGIVIMTNKAYCQLISKPREEIEGNNFNIIYTENQQEIILNNYKERFKNHTLLQHYEKEFVLWNGKKVWFEVSDSFLEVEDQPTLQLSIFRDITQRKNLELQLLQSQTMESIGRLAGGIAHDFNNMLTAVLGSAEMIVNLSQKDEKIFRHGSRIKQAAQRGADLARQLLTFAKLETYNLIPTSINEIIDETVKLLERTFQKSINLEINLEQNLPLINGDPGRLQQVFLNLCVNARDAMPKGGKLEIKTGIIEINDSFLEKPKDLPAGNYILVQISDTGIGMDEYTKLKIFEPFFTTKKRGKGTGLGLSTAYGIIQIHKGFITVNSIPGKGTTFNIHLPLSEPQIKTKINESNENLIGGTKSILVIDDEEVVMETLKEMLKNLNFTVYYADNGAEGIDLYKINKNKIDLIILDLVMPKMSGEEVFQHLKTVNPGVKVLIASGLLGSDTIKELKEAGVSGFIQKPYQSSELETSIREILNK